MLPSVGSRLGLKLETLPWGLRPRAAGAGRGLAPQARREAVSLLDGQRVAPEPRGPAAPLPSKESLKSGGSQR